MINYFELLFSGSGVTRRIIVRAEDSENAIRIFKANRRMCLKKATVYHLQFPQNGLLVRQFNRGLEE